MTFRVSCSRRCRARLTGKAIKLPTREWHVRDESEQVKLSGGDEEFLRECKIGREEKARSDRGGPRQHLAGQKLQRY